MTDTSTVNALWTPAWYELDQSLMLGERKKFWFFQDQPIPSIGSEQDQPELVFFNQLDSSENCCVRYARILEMIHPQLGPLLRVDTDGLDYIFYPVLGEEVVVNAEESPGVMFQEQPGHDITDWTVYVKLADVSAPSSELV